MQFYDSTIYLIVSLFTRLFCLVNNDLMAPVDTKDINVRKCGLQYYKLGLKVATFDSSMRFLHLQRKIAKLPELPSKDQLKSVIKEVEDSISIAKTDPNLDYCNASLELHNKWLLQASLDTTQELLERMATSSK